MQKIAISVRNFLLRTSRDVLIVLVIGLTISMLFSWGSILKSSDHFLKSAIYSLVIGSSLWKVNELFSRIIARFFPWHVRPKFTLFLDVVGTILISALVIFLVNHYLYFLISDHPIKERPQYFFLVGIIQLFISLVITSIFYISRFFTEWRKLLVSEEELKREALALQYEALKSYVNPHFLFNSLSVLNSLVDAHPPKAKVFISRFSDVYRYVLQQRDKDLVLLAEELEFAESYIQLIKIRQGDALNVTIDVADRAGWVVPVSLQILLENAFTHNEASMENPLQVTLTREGNHLVVTNNFQPRKVVSNGSGIGLPTIARSYERLGHQKLEVIHQNGYFRVHLPIISEASIGS
ncbi:sensor histidine kinase [Geofilum rubicundum]|uniref:Putative two-component system sensor protein histidine kinase n=1 Tax=Geofilum rubicundum JCM 15548 TaxID=1236989 RepID=A0A0E9LRN7_9BACT|nr:sensor histidine kinase [Geofilum rubicundum]GAO27821.1 putative two-component system sensor protein histidine kinase [Geofilum rubicundum JCM 15548]